MKKLFHLQLLKKRGSAGTKVITTKPATNVQAYEPISKPQIAKMKPTVKAAEPAAASHAPSEKSTQDQE
jgi:hypothetical protein